MPAESPPSSVSERTSLGQRLRIAREERGISLQEIAQRTKIAVSSLDALEHDNPSRLPSGIFARSFVRAYAAEVGLDPDQTLREFLRRFPEHAPPGSEPDEASDVGTSSGSRSGRVLAVFGLLAALGGIAGGGYWWWQQRQQQPVRQVAASPLESRVSAGAAGETTGTPASVPSGGPAPGATLQPTSPAAEAAPVQPTPTQPAPAQGAPPQEARAQQVPSALPAGALRIEVHPTGPCWVRLEVDGRVVLERVVQPGERIVRDAGSAVRLQVGDAGAFAFTLNGQAGRSLGAAGQVARADITPNNATTFVAR